MAVQPASSRQGFPRWLIYVGIGVVVCGLICAVAVGLTLLTPAINAGRLPDVCMQQNQGFDRHDCEAWADGVKRTAEYQTCFQQDASTGHPDPNNLYACLVENGVGPK